jgi:hypothetical protein
LPYVSAGSGTPSKAAVAVQPNGWHNFVVKHTPSTPVINEIAAQLGREELGFD